MSDDSTIWAIVCVTILILTLVAGYNLGENTVYEKIINLEQTKKINNLNK